MNFTQINNNINLYERGHNTHIPGDKIYSDAKCNGWMTSEIGHSSTSRRTY